MTQLFLLLLQSLKIFVFIFPFVSFCLVFLCDAMLLGPDVCVLEGAWQSSLQDTCNVWAEADTETPAAAANGQ